MPSRTITVKGISDKNSNNLKNLFAGKGNQNWEYHHDTQTIRHPNTHKCLTLAENKEKLLMEKCDSNEERQRWRFGSYNSTLAEQFHILQ